VGSVLREDRMMMKRERVNRRKLEEMK